MKIRLIVKKLLIVCNLLVVLILFSSASSSWEGSSSADTYRALPERGFYVASNSFPRYTVVDIVNLETGKTIQAIVIDNSSSPGNAVILSRDAAEALGMGSRSSGRIRISPRSDSEAFSPFADGRSFSGDPDYDPKAFVRENTLPLETQAIVSPLARNDEGYPSAPPPVEIIPDPVKAPVETAPEAPKTEMAQADVPTTTYPLLPPVEPTPFFMPPPIPTAVFVEDENPVPESAPEAAPAAAQELPSEPAQLETPSTVRPAPSAPELSMFIPMPLPAITAFEESPETAPDFEAPELPEISETPYALSNAGQDPAIPYPGASDYVLVPELEPENPFPDVSPMYPNPAGDNDLPMALNEAARDKIDDAFRQEEALAEGLPPELTLPGQSPYENETIDNLAEVIEGISENPDVITYQNPPEAYIPSGRYLDEPNTGNAFTGGVSKDSDEMAGELGPAEASLVYAEPGMNGTIELEDGRWVLKDPTGQDYVMGDALPPETVSPLIASASESELEEELYDAIFRGEVFAESSLPYAEPGMEGTIDLVDGRWILTDSEGEEYIVSSGLPPEEVLALIERPDVDIGLLPDALFRGEEEIVSSGLPPEEVLALIERPDVGIGLLPDALFRGEEEIVSSGLPPEEVLALIERPDVDIGLLPDALFRGEEEIAETSMEYAEPGMEGTIELVDGRWILIDYADVEYLLPYTGTDLLSLLLPDYVDSVETGLPYAEPGMEGTIELVDGRWIIRDYADVEYLLQTPYSADLVRLLLPSYTDNAETALSYAEPDETGMARLPDAHSKQAETDAVSEFNNLIYILTSEAQLADRATVDLGPYMPYPNDDTPEFNIVFAGDEAAIRNIYNTIVSIESAPNRPPEVIVDIGPIREDESDRTASLLLIKHLANDKYYLQIGLFDRKDVLARELTNLNWAYPYALETSENPQSPMYKLLVGPVNEGESNALLLRFKRYGYNDAFIRKEG